MKKVTIILASLLASVTFAQETEAPKSTPLEISGSGDLYYKYDFSKYENIGTSFATDKNSVSLGMIDIALKKKTGKASFVGEVSFGPRGQSQSIPNAIGGLDETTANSFNIQNLYASYAVSDKLTLTAGYMGTFIGYEVISPLANFHYSTSYLFTNGPFQNAGVKVNYAISKKVGLMVGAFNDSWNKYKADPMNGLNATGVQLSVMPTDKISAYLNFLGGSETGNIFDLTATFQLTDKFKLGLNAADYDSGNNNSTYNYTGFALYPSYKVNDNFSLGLRGEYFEYENLDAAIPYATAIDSNVFSSTLSANYKVGGLTIIPEVRLDNNDKKVFYDSNMNMTKSAAQATIALVYGF